MMPVLLPATEAALFTFGCIAIHGLRRHADVVTAALACIATLLVLLMGVAYAPEPFAQIQTANLAEVGLIDPSIY